MTAGASRAATTIKQPALAPSPQHQPAPTARALPPKPVAQGYVGRILRLTLLATEIVEAIVTGGAAGDDDAGNADASVLDGLGEAKSRARIIRKKCRGTPASRSRPFRHCCTPCRGMS